ncbi:MAG: hypothetical protein M1821_009780 [Bathelium mastoideum]|nr:MAG: hypothetical protein M1821_009780 [Bathelium mastoideum]
MLTVHHLGIAQSERVVWLCEELGIPYNLVKHTRAPILAPESLKNLPGNGTGRAPFIEDSAANVTLSESGAVCEYIIHRYGDGRLAAKPTDQNYADYLHWFHFVNGSLQPAMITSMWMRIAEIPEDKQVMQLIRARQNGTLQYVDDRLKSNKWLAGSDFTAADIMAVYTLSTQRYYTPLDLGPFPNIVRWLGDCGSRDAYKRAMEKGDPEMKLLLGAQPPEKSLLQTDGVNSGHWKK